MKIIDLAEKQLNSEKLPKHIRYNDEDLYFDGVSYYDKQRNNDLLDILAMENSAITHLYDEVEIIEEDKKIEKLENETKFYNYAEYEKRCDIDKVLYILKAINLTEEKIDNLNNKINELIDAVNSMNRGE